jgi:hypothetical protein
VSISQEDGLLALRSMSVAPLAVAERPTARARRAHAEGRGDALLGRVINKPGAPVGTRA